MRETDVQCKSASQFLGCTMDHTNTHIQWKEIINTLISDKSLELLSLWVHPPLVSVCSY